MSTQQIRIETNGSACGTRVLDGDGKPLATKIFDVAFRHHVGKLPVLTVQQYLTEFVLEGEVTVERASPSAQAARSPRATSRHMRPM